MTNARHDKHQTRQTLDKTNTRHDIYKAKPQTHFYFQFYAFRLVRAKRCVYFYIFDYKPKMNFFRKVTICYVQPLLCLVIVMSSVCYVQCLFCLVFVISSVCYVQGLLCLAFVMTRVCYVQGLLCLGSVMSRVCYVQHLLCLGFVCLGSVMSRVCLSSVSYSTILGYQSIKRFINKTVD